MTDDKKKQALAAFMQALDGLAEVDDGKTPGLMMLLLWEEFGPEIDKAAQAEGYENAIEWAEDRIAQAELDEVAFSALELGAGVHILTQAQADEFHYEKNEHALH